MKDVKFWDTCVCGGPRSSSSLPSSEAPEGSCRALGSQTRPWLQWIRLRGGRMLLQRPRCFKWPVFGRWSPGQCPVWAWSLGLYSGPCTTQRRLLAVGCRQAENHRPSSVKVFVHTCGLSATAIGRIFPENSTTYNSGETRQDSRVLATSNSTSQIGDVKRDNTRQFFLTDSQEGVGDIHFS